MKVLMFGWEFPPHISGGLGTACFGLTQGLMKQGAEIIFVVPRAYGDEDQSAIRLVNASDVAVNFRSEAFARLYKNLTYMEVNSTLVPYVGEDEYYKILNGQEKFLRSADSIHQSRYVFSGSYGANLMQEVRRYAYTAVEIARDNTFDVIHAHDWLTYLAGIAAKEVSHKPLVIHVHATEFDRSGENVNTLVYDIEKQGMEKADRIITVSNWTRDIVINKYGINPDKVVTIHNAVEPSDSDSVFYKKNVKEKLVTFLGRVTFQKGPEYFVESAYRILQKVDNVRFVLAGDGDMLPKIIERVAVLNMGDRFHFTGFLRGKDVDRMLGMSDVYVMPSVSEPFGISPLEAMRSNVPVVISRQSGVSEVLTYALKVNFWDIEEMADAIYGLLTYEPLAEMFRKNGRTEVYNMKWENAARKLVEEYKRLLQ